MKKITLIALILFALLGVAAFIGFSFSSGPSQISQESKDSSSVPESDNPETGVGSGVASYSSAQANDDGDLDALDFNEVPQFLDDTLTYEEFVAILCEEVGQQECEKVLGPTESSSGVPNSSPATSPKPRSSGGQRDTDYAISDGLMPPDFSSNFPEDAEAAPEAYLPCPKTRDENPEGYKRCYGGYVAPTFEFAGYQSCRKVNDPTYGLVVQVRGRIRLLGGNFVSSDWGPQSELQGENSYRTVSSTHYFEDMEGRAAFTLSWHEYIRIASMDVTNTYVDWIDTVVSHGVYSVDVNLMDPACLSD